jgi:AMMECR1 domain-containing protein
MWFLWIRNSTIPVLVGLEETDVGSALFVTWNLVSSGGKKLRGCIGTFEPLPLARGLKSYALTAYFLPLFRLMKCI